MAVSRTHRFDQDCSEYCDADKELELERNCHDCKAFKGLGVTACIFSFVGMVLAFAWALSVLPGGIAAGGIGTGGFFLMVTFAHFENRYHQSDDWFDGQGKLGASFVLYVAGFVTALISSGLVANARPVDSDEGAFT